MVFHASSFGLVKDNVVFNVAGFGIGTENGQETEISFINNFVSGINGSVGRGKFQFNGSGDTEADIGSGFWFATADHTLIGNVCTTVAKSCYDIYSTRLGFPYLIIAAT
jgi:hypothetical protein